MLAFFNSVSERFQAGEEIYVPYGEYYWRVHAGTRMETIAPEKKFLTPHAKSQTSPQRNREESG